MKNSNGLNQKGRIVAFLTREEIDFIDKLAKDALFSTGHKLSRTDIIRAFVDTIRIKDINGDGVDSKTSLEKRLLSVTNLTLPQALYDFKKEKNEDEAH